MRVGLIGGTGIDEMQCFAEGKANSVSTGWGSAEVIESRIDGNEVVFLPRHGASHQTPPSLINYRAQIAALKKLQVEAVVSVCAVGSLKTALPPGSFAVLTDFIDFTKRRADTFFDADTGPVVHTDLTEPYCPTVSGVLSRACKAADVPFSSRATYIGVEGPRYETPAEIRLYASWGGDVIGMTNVPEVILAREAGLCYGALAVVTNLACGISPTPLDHSEVRAAMAEAGVKLQSVVLTGIHSLQTAGKCQCGSNCQLTI